MSRYKWWKYRPGKLTRGQVITERKHLEEQVSLAQRVATYTGGTMNLSSHTTGSLPVNIIPEEIEIVNGFHTGQSVSEAIESLHDRVNAQEYSIDYNISNGNCLDLSNSLRNLSAEGFQDHELTDALRRLILRDRVG